MPVGSVESLGPSITYFVSCKGAIQGGIGALVAVVFAHGAASVGNRFLEKFLQTRFRISLEGDVAILASGSEQQLWARRSQRPT